MIDPEPLAMVACSDLSGHVKGKGFPLTDRAARMRRGIGWVPTNAQITCFNNIAPTPFGALGDLLLIPDPETEVRLDWGTSTAEHWFLGDIRELDGSPWSCCLRTMLSAALEALRQETGLTLRAAFEMEFQFLDPAAEVGAGYGLTGFREKKRFGEVLLGALKAVGIAPDSFLKEWGPRQYEVTIHPRTGLRAADEAVIARELTQATARHLSDPVTFTPVLEAGGVGNGLHIHMSLEREDGTNATHDPAGPGGLSGSAAAFVAGILHHLPSLVAFTAPSVVSYARLVPHRWSAAFNNLGRNDREAAVRLCPVAQLPGMDTARQFHFEFRAADNAASPYLQLAVLVLAGLDGIRRRLSPPTPTHENLAALDERALAARGLRRLPTSLAEALDALDADDAVRSWFQEPFVELYLMHKRGEIDHVRALDETALHAAYAAVY